MHLPYSANKVSKLEKETAVTIRRKNKKHSAEWHYFFPFIAESDEKYYFCEVIF